jgi:hypothetical protein
MIAIVPGEDLAGDFLVCRAFHDMIAHNSPITEGSMQTS